MKLLWMVIRWLVGVTMEAIKSVEEKRGNEITEGCTREGRNEIQ